MDPLYPPWMMNRFVIPHLCFLPIGYQGELVGEPVSKEPVGIPLAPDPTVPPVTDLGRITNLVRPNYGWKHQAIVRTVGDPANGYLAYKHPGKKWRIRVRGRKVDLFDVFKVNLSGQETQLALLDEDGNEVPLMLVATLVPIDDPSYGKLPTY